MLRTATSAYYIKIANTPSFSVDGVRGVCNSTPMHNTPTHTIPSPLALALAFEVCGNTTQAVALANLPIPVDAVSVDVDNTGEYVHVDALTESSDMTFRVYLDGSVEVEVFDGEPGSFQS